MSDGDQAPAGWYPDFWTPSRKRYWTGSSWTFSTVDGAAVDDPPPLDVAPLPGGHGLPAPVVRRPQADTAPVKAPNKSWKWGAAVLVGVVVGIIGLVFSTRSPSRPSRSDSETADRLAPSTNQPTTTIPVLNAGNDPSASALETLIVKPADVPASVDVVVFQGGVGLSMPTLDLCNGTYPSESRRTARIQDAVLDASGALSFSTEAVLYGDSGGTTQAFAELQTETAGCPRAPRGQPPYLTTFNPAPDAAWPQVPTVNRRAYDLLTDDGSGRPPSRTIAVYLQRGRVLLGVYFSQPDRPQVPVEGKTTVEGIVGVFAARVAALPTSVVGA